MLLGSGFWHNWTLLLKEKINYYNLGGFVKSGIDN